MPEVAIPGLILVAVVIATSLQSYIFLMATRKLIYRIIHLYDVTASVPTNIHPLTSSIQKWSLPVQLSD